MNFKRKSFLNAGAIIAIILAAVFSLVSIVLIVIAPFVTTENFCEVYEKDTENYKTYYVNSNKDEGYDYFVELNNGEETSKVIYFKDVDKLAKLIRRGMITFGWLTIILQVATFIISLFVMRDVKRGNNRIAFIITLMVLSLFGINLLTFAFMVVGLCLKNEEPSELGTIIKA